MPGIYYFLSKYLLNELIHVPSDLLNLSKLFLENKSMALYNKVGQELEITLSTEIMMKYLPLHLSYLIIPKTRKR